MSTVERGQKRSRSGIVIHDGDTNTNTVTTTTGGGGGGGGGGVAAAATASSFSSSKPAAMTALVVGVDISRPRLDVCRSLLEKKARHVFNSMVATPALGLPDSGGFAQGQGLANGLGSLRPRHLLFACDGTQFGQGNSVYTSILHTIVSLDIAISTLS